MLRNIWAYICAGSDQPRQNNEHAHCLFRALGVHKPFRFENVSDRVAVQTIELARRPQLRNTHAVSYGIERDTDHVSADESPSFVWNHRN